MYLFVLLHYQFLGFVEQLTKCLFQIKLQQKQHCNRQCETILPTMVLPLLLFKFMSLAGGVCVIYGIYCKLHIFFLVEYHAKIKGNFSVNNLEMLLYLTSQDMKFLNFVLLR